LAIEKWRGLNTTLVLLPLALLNLPLSSTRVNQDASLGNTQTNVGLSTSTHGLSDRL
jgi:hypothetical protein